MAKQPEPVRITSAARSHRDDVNARQRRYLISMGIRTLCFVLAVVSIGHWFMWLFIVASFVLPYVAVVMANAGGFPDTGGPAAFAPDLSLRALEPGEQPVDESVHDSTQPEGSAGASWRPTEEPAPTERAGRSPTPPGQPPAQT